MTILESFLIDLFSSFRERGIRYCVYGGYESLPESIEDDLDIVIEPSFLEELDGILLDLSVKYWYLLVSRIWHDERKIAYILADVRGDVPVRIQLDFIGEYTIRDFRSKNFLRRYRLFETNFWLSDCRKREYLILPSPEKEFLFKFLRRIFKNDFLEKPGKIRYLKDMFSDHGREIEGLLKKELGISLDGLMEALKIEDLGLLTKEAASFVHGVCRRCKVRKTPGWWVNLLSRLYERVNRPVGITLLVEDGFLEGMDGSEENFIQNVNRFFHRVANFDLNQMKSLFLLPMLYVNEVRKTINIVKIGKSPLLYIWSVVKGVRRNFDFLLDFNRVDYMVQAILFAKYLLELTHYREGGYSDCKGSEEGNAIRRIEHIHGGEGKGKVFSTTNVYHSFMDLIDAVILPSFLKAMLYHIVDYLSREEVIVVDEKKEGIAGRTEEFFPYEDVLNEHYMAIMRCSGTMKHVMKLVSRDGQFRKYFAVWLLKKLSEDYILASEKSRKEFLIYDFDRMLEYLISLYKMFRGVEIEK